MLYISMQIFNSQPYDLELFPSLLIKILKVLPVQIQTTELDTKDLDFNLEMQARDFCTQLGCKEQVEFSLLL